MMLADRVIAVSQRIKDTIISDYAVPADKIEVTATLEVQANARPGEYTVALTGQGQVPFAKDPKAGARPNTLVPLPSRRTGMRPGSAG